MKVIGAGCGSTCCLINFMGGRYGFCSGAYKLQSPLFSNESCVNFYPEIAENPNTISAITLLHTPGLKVDYALPETAVPALFTVNGRSFAAGASFYELFANGTFTNWGTLNGPPFSPTQIFCCQTHLLILSNGDLFVFVLVPVTDSMGVLHPANSFIAVNMAQFNGPVLQIDFCDGYFLAAIQNSNTFQVSNLEDGTTWNGLFISTISYFPDNIVSMKVDHREAWFFSGKKTIAYYNVGAGFPPFIPIQGAFLEDGSAATFGVVTAKDTICWIAQDDRGLGTIKMMGSYIGQRISTIPIEIALQSYSKISDAVGYSFQLDGHNFLKYRFPSANVTWVYDFTTSLWHREGFWNSGTGTYIAHRSTSHMFNFGKHFVGDWMSGNIYETSNSLWDDFGNPIVRERAGPNLSASNKWIYFNSVEFLMQMGLGPMPPLLDGNGQPRGPIAMLSWVDNLSRISNTCYLDCGQAGVTNLRARKVMLGRSRLRQFVLRVSDPVPWAIADSFIEATCDGEPIYTSSERMSEQYRKVT